MIILINTEIFSFEYKIMFCQAILFFWFYNDGSFTILKPTSIAQDVHFFMFPP